MNTKSLLLAGALGLSLAGLADAQQYVYLTGSTACRGVLDTTLRTSVFDSTPTYVYMGASASGKANYINYKGNIGGVQYIVKCHWSGSEGGIADLAGTQEQFLDDSVTTSSSGTPTGGNLTAAQTVDIAMADNSVLYSRIPGASVTGTNVGIIAFEWVAEKGSAASLTNVTDTALRQAIAGNAKLCLFSGNPADTTRVYVSGRDNSSGTRVNAFGTCRFGIFTIPNQIEVSATDSSMAVLAHDPITSDPIYVGDYGWSSGGSLASQMGYDLSLATSKDVGPLGDGSSHFSVIGYLGKGDADSAVSAGGKVLTYNGVPFSVQAIQNGQYNFWGVEYIYRRNAAGSSAVTVYNKLAASTGIAANADGNALISLSSMKVERSAPTDDPH